MKNFFKRSPSETLQEDALLQEIDERHFISEQVFHRREEKGWSQEQLANVSGMTQAQIANIEAGQANPTLRTLVKIAHAFGCTVSELLVPLEDQDDGRIPADEQAAEVLRRESYDLHSWDEGSEHLSEEFLLRKVAGPPPLPSGQGGFQAFSFRLMLQENRRSVEVESEGADLDLTDITETLEL